MPGSVPEGYKTPKTDWTSGDIVFDDDFKRIEGNNKAIEEGSRTIDPFQAPTSNVGNLRNFLDWFANRLKDITGEAHWYTAAGESLKAVAQRLTNHEGDTNNPHNVNASQVGAAPIGHVGAGGNAHAIATDSVAGFMSPESQEKLDALESFRFNNGAFMETTTIAANTTYTKSIPLGDVNFKLFVLKLAWSSTSRSGAIVIGGATKNDVGTVNAEGVTSDSSVNATNDLLGGAIYSVNSWLSTGHAKGNRGYSGNQYIGLNYAHINGSNLEIQWRNYAGTDQNTNINGTWEVLG